MTVDVKKHHIDKTSSGSIILKLSNFEAIGAIGAIGAIFEIEQFATVGRLSILGILALPCQYLLPPYLLISVCLVPADY